MTRSFRLLIVIAIGYSIYLVAPPAWSQISANANAAAASPDAQLKALRQELSALEGRVHELEKKAEEAKNNDDESAQSKKVEQRLAALEKEQAKLESEEAGAGKQRTAKGEEAAPSHVTAPFVVYDDDGHVIFRVAENANVQGSVMTLGNATGAHVAISASDEAESSSVRIFGGKNGAESDATLSGSAASYLQLKSREAKHETVLGVGKDNRYGLFLSGGEIGSAALMSTPSGAGYLDLANNKGQLVAEGGANPKGVGIFLTGPSCCDPPDAVGPHEYILGRNR